MNKEKTQKIIDILHTDNVDAWLMYSFDRLNPIAEKITGFTEASRRWFYIIKSDGTQKLLCQSIEEGYFKKFDIPYETYSSQDEMYQKLKSLLAGAKTLCMEYSPLCEIPYISKVDAGTVELIKSVSSPDLVIKSSARLVQQMLTTWGSAGVASHIKTITHLHEIIAIAWKQITDDIRENGASNEYKIQSIIVEEFSKRGLRTNHPAIVAAGKNSADAHYCPTSEASDPIVKDQVVMIDLWAIEKDNPEAAYGDITWMGYTSDSVPEEVLSVWNILKQARDAGVSLLKEKLPAKVMGWEVDSATRTVIEQANYGAYFTHRTGHSIAHELHAEGVNMDNFELHDIREIIPDCGFSIEPGIYIPNLYGFRSEIDVHIDENMKVQVYGIIQDKLLTF